MTWIDINKEVPEYYTPVIIYCDKNQHMCIAWRHSDGEREDYTIYDSNQIFMYEVTHWQHLPNKPKK